MGGTGPRRLLVFPYSTPNMGPGSLIIGDSQDPASAPLFEWGACHGHWHFKKYAAYRLWTPTEFARSSSSGQQIRTLSPMTSSLATTSARPSARREASASSTLP